MSLSQRMRDHFVRAIRGDHVRKTFWIHRNIDFRLVPIIEQLATGTYENRLRLYASFPYFMGDRPRIAIVKGHDVSLNIEGPEFECRDLEFPRGAEVFVNGKGCLALGPVDAVALHCRVSKAVDLAVLQWLNDTGKVGELSLGREQRDRVIADQLAFAEMVAAAGLTVLGTEAGDA